LHRKVQPVFCGQRSFDRVKAADFWVCLSSKMSAQCTAAHSWAQPWYLHCRLPDWVEVPDLDFSNSFTAYFQCPL
jgi:hypothetical protein